MRASLMSGDSHTAIIVDDSVTLRQRDDDAEMQPRTPIFALSHASPPTLMTPWRNASIPIMSDKTISLFMVTKRLPRRRA